MLNTLAVQGPSSAEGEQHSSRDWGFLMLLFLFFKGLWYLQLRVNRQRSCLARAKVSFSLVRSFWQHLRFAAHAGITLGVNPSSTGMKKSSPWLIQVGWTRGTALDCDCLGARCYSWNLGGVWGHKDSVLCLQITPPALGLVVRDLIAAFYLSSLMALGFHHPVTLSFGVPSSS